MNLKQRSYQKELLDADDIPSDDIKKNMEELDFINTYLNGHAITINGFKKLLGNRKQVSVCEIGCGGGDNLAAIRKWCHHRGIELEVMGVDLKEDCISIAKQQPSLHGATWLTSDYKEVVFEQQPDIIFSSLFCHHFSDGQLIEQLQWLKANCKIGFFINDLQRHWLAYHSIKYLTKLFSSSYLVKNDAPLSVAKGFVRDEWDKIFQSANIDHYTVQWKWAFRYLITYQHD